MGLITTQFYLVKYKCSTDNLLNIVTLYGKHYKAGPCFTKNSLLDRFQYYPFFNLTNIKYTQSSLTHSIHLLQSNTPFSDWCLTHTVLNTSSTLVFIYSCTTSNSLLIHFFTVIKICCIIS